jgi:DNA-binding transcriptional ArsR family regulator
MMKKREAENVQESAHEILEKIFHEPSRLAIMSALCASDRGMSFVALRDTCRLSDGNLNRHLKVLEEAKAIVIKKRFVKNKPQTTVRISEKGLRRFQEYLVALSQVLQGAQQALPAEAKQGAIVTDASMVRA